MRAVSIEELEEVPWVILDEDGSVAAFVASGDLDPGALGLDTEGHYHAGCDLPTGLDLSYAIFRGELVDVDLLAPVNDLEEIGRQRDSPHWSLRY